MSDRLSPRAILDALVAFPTVSRDSNLPLVDWVEAYLAGHGIATHRHWNADRDKAGLFAHVGPNVDGGVVLSGHTDVVPTDGQDWTKPAFAVTEAHGRLYGRGTTDMKGFDALAIWALVEAHHAGVKRPLQIALSYDEEIGCTGVLPRAADVIVGEPTQMQAVTGHKGGISFWVHVHGYEVHSSLLYKGVSAIMEGAKLITWAGALNAEAAAAPPAGMAALFDPPYTNVHVGQIKGGTAHNIAAKDCEFGIGFRVVPGQDPEDWRARLLEKVAEIEAGMQAIRPETRIAVTETFALPAFAPTDDNSAEALVRRLTGDNASHYVSYGTEASHFQAAGYNAVVCGPGDIAVAHQPDEYITCAEFDKGHAFMRRLVEHLRS